MNETFKIYNCDELDARGIELRIMKRSEYNILEDDLYIFYFGVNQFKVSYLDSISQFAVNCAVPMNKPTTGVTFSIPKEALDLEKRKYMLFEYGSGSNYMGFIFCRHADLDFYLDEDLINDCEPRLMCIKNKELKSAMSYFIEGIVGKDICYSPNTPDNEYVIYDFRIH